MAKATATNLEQHRPAKDKQRRDGWHARLDEQKRAGGRHVFTCLKRDETRWAPSPLGKQRQLDEADASWWQLWGREAFTDEQRFCGLQLAQEGTRVPQLGPITGAQLQRSELSMGKKKAAEADGLQAVDWANWPKQHWNRLDHLAHLREEQGLWPQHFLIAHAVLLSKGGMPVDKLQPRPLASCCRSFTELGREHRPGSSTRPAHRCANHRQGGDGGDSPRPTWNVTRGCGQGLPRHPQKPRSREACGPRSS